MLTLTWRARWRTCPSRTGRTGSKRRARCRARLPKRALTWRPPVLAACDAAQKEEAEKYAREQAAKKLAAAKAKPEVPEISKAIARPMPPRKRS